MAALTDLIRQKEDCDFITNLNMVHKGQTDERVQIVLKSKFFDIEANRKHEITCF